MGVSLTVFGFVTLLVILPAESFYTLTIENREKVITMAGDIKMRYGPEEWMMLTMPQAGRWSLHASGNGYDKMLETLEDDEPAFIIINLETGPHEEKTLSIGWIPPTSPLQKKMAASANMDSLRSLFHKEFGISSSVDPIDTKDEMQKDAIIAKLP